MLLSLFLRWEELQKKVRWEGSFKIARSLFFCSLRELGWRWELTPGDCGRDARHLVQPPLLLRRHAARPDSRGKGEDALKENGSEPSLDTSHFLSSFLLAVCGQLP